MNGWVSPIIVVSTGLLNTVNDVVVGGQSGLGSGSTAATKFGGQLGKILFVSASQIAQMFSSTVGTLYAGAYQYVKLTAGAAANVVGQSAFWKSGSNINDFEVTTAASGGATGVPMPAGVFISIPTAGRYCFIQVAGLATVKYKSGLTVAAATGQPVITNTAGLADTDAGTNVPNFLGTSWTLPVSNGSSIVQLSSHLLSRA